MQPDAHDQRRPTLRGVALRALGVVAAVWLLAGASATAQPGGPTGRDFAGLAMPAPLQSADVEVSGARGWAWSEGGAQRLYIEGDARVRVGLTGFSAARVTAWFEPLTGAPTGAQRWQLAMYLEDVEDPGADAIVAQSARRLLVTAVVAGDVRVRPDVFLRGRPDAGEGAAFVREGEGRLSRYLAQLLAGEAPALTRGALAADIVDREAPLTVESVGRIDPATLLPAVDQPEPIFASEGIITFFGPDRTLVAGDEESALVISGGVIVQYTDVAQGRSLQLTAQSVVVFLDPGRIVDILRFTADQIRGIYLEGDVVATDGSYTLRGPRFYYDLRTNRGVALESVFWTYNEERGLPLYLRADVIRQESLSQWSAGRARLANTSFFEPHYTLGAKSVTLTRVEREGAPDDFEVDARGVAYRVGKVAVAKIPRYQGQVTGRRAPKLSVSTKNGDPIIFTRWDLYSLLGMNPIEGLDIDLLLDGYINRGLAVGADITWRTDDADASIFGTFIHDDGTDSLTSGAEIDRDGDDRGMLVAELRRRIDDRWTLFAEGSYISDAAFVDAFYPQMAETRREFASSAYLRQIDGRSLFSLEARGAINNFTPNEYLLQSRGYQVERLPEARYARVGDPLFGGLLVYSSESSLGAVRMRFTESRAEEFGFDTVARAESALGLLPEESPADLLRAGGLTEETVLRADTRHEVSMPARVGELNVAPFAVGRVTAYDTDFDEFRSGENDDTARLWGGGGVRLATTLQRVDDSVESRFLDLRRMRHLVEPSVTVFSAAGTLESGELPTYDEHVEGILNGTILRAGVRNTWQTRRGGGDIDRSVDWLMINADYVWSSEETQRRSPLGRFSESRPELSNAGEYITTEAVLRLTDAVALTTDWQYDYETNQTQTIAAGALVDHGSGYAAFVELRDVRPLEATFLHFGVAQRLTARYTFDASAALDMDENNFQSVRASITRRFAQLTAEVGVDFDDIRDDTTLSIVLRPIGLRPRDQSPLRYSRGADALDLREAPLLPSSRIGG